MRWIGLTEGQTAGEGSDFTVGSDDEELKLRAREFLAEKFEPFLDGHFRISRQLVSKRLCA